MWPFARRTVQYVSIEILVSSQIDDGTDESLEIIELQYINLSANVYTHVAS